MAQSLSSSSSAASALSFRRTAIACAALQLLVGIAMLTPVMMPTTAHAQTAETKRAYDIPAGQLTSALQRFGRQAEVMLSFSAELTDGLTSQGIAGQYTVQGGLNAVLEGTGVQALRQENGGYVLQKMAAPVSRADETTLPSVTVRAERDPVTEGTGSYAVRAASTATKLNLSLRETPQSVTVVTRKQMEDMGAQSLTDIMSEVTGIVVQSLDTERTNYTSRGYQISTYQIDGVNTAYSNGYVKLVSDPAVYDRIEVLRGAAGHTVGAGDPGGTINQVRKRPTSEFAGSIGLTMGRWNSRRLELDLGGPLALNGHLRGRMVAVKQEADSFRDWYTSDKEVFYGILEADLGPRTMVSLGYDYQKPENSGVTWGTIPYWLSNGSLANMPRSFNPAARWSQWNVQQQQAFARVDHRFNDDWKLRVTYTQDEQKSYGSRWFGGAGYFPNPDGTGKSAWYGGGDNYGTATSWDVDLNGRFDLFGRSHSVNVGYHTEEAKNNTPAGVDVYPADFFSVIPDWRNWDGNVPQYVRNYLGYDSSYSIGKQSALYAAANLQLADSLKAVVGARYGDWEKYNWTYSPSTGGYTRSGYAIDNVVTPYASLLYDVSKNFTVYGSYTDIFTPQGYRNFNGDYLDPVNGKHFELGLKGEFFDGALNTNIAIFRSKKDNVAEIDDTGSLPAGSFDPANPPAGYNNAGYRVIPGTEEVAYRATGKGNQMEGYEFEVQGALSRNWNLAGGYTHISMKDKNGLAIQTYLPRNTLRLRTSYRLPGDWSKLALGGGITWQSETWANVNGVPTGQPGVTETRRITQSAFYLLNFSAQYQMSKQLSFNFNINNLLDKTYYSRVGFYSGVMYGTPRDVRLNMRYTF